MAESKFVTDERRVNKRYSVIIGAFHVVNPQSREQLGEILDISQGGLAFRYDENDGELNESEEISIVSASNKTLVGAISYVNVNDFEESCSFPFDFNKRRRRGVRFVNLSPANRVQVESFIKSAIKNAKY